MKMFVSPSSNVSRRLCHSLCVRSLSSGQIRKPVSINLQNVETSQSQIRQMSGAQEHIIINLKDDKKYINRDRTCPSSLVCFTYFICTC